MKFLVLSLFLSATSAFAAGSDDALAPLKLSSSCESKIFKSMEAICNKDSKDDSSREHPCEFWGQVDIKRNAEDSAYFEADFTVTDADVYTYGASIESKEKCEFKVVSRNSN